MRKLGIVLLIMLGFALISGLYVLKTRTQTAYREVARLTKMLEQERDTITVLNAEIAHLESPARLAQLGDQYLELRPTEAEQILTLDELVIRVPLREASVDASALGGEGAP